MRAINPPKNVPIYETSLLLCWMGEDGILYSRSKPGDRSIENYNELFSLYDMLSHSGTKKLCTLGDISKTKPLAKHVREYITKELGKYLKAMALVSDTPMGKVIGNTVMSVSQQPYPTNVFNTREEAIVWLKGYL